MTMLDWIPMDIIQMILQISLIPYDVIPKTSLPDINWFLDMMSLLEISGVISFYTVHNF